MPEIKSVVKLDIFPEPESIALLDKHSRICNWLYNQLLETSLGLRKQYLETQSPEISKVLYSKRGLRNLIPDLKKQYPFLKQVHSSPLKNTGLRLSESIQAYQKSRKGKRKGKATGWPRFRSWKASWFSLFYDEPGKGFKVLEKTVQISLGKEATGANRFLRIPMPDASVLKGKQVLNFRLVKQNGQFKAVFTVSRKIPEPKPPFNMIALDPNHKNLAYGVDSSGRAIEIESAWWLKRFDKQLDEVTAKRDRCQRQSQLKEVLNSEGEPIGKQYWEPSRRWKKLNATKEKILAKRREQTKTYLFTVSHALCRRYDVIACGHYAPHGNGINPKMRRAMNNRSLIGRFKDTLSWVTLKSGKHYLEFDEKGTTRTCHACSYVMSEGLLPSIRDWVCPSCQTQHIRDENAAINGMNRALGGLKEKGEAYASLVPSSGLAPVSVRCAWRVQPSGVLSKPRGLGSEFNLQAPGN